jgi:hypothetical protein
MVLLISINNTFTDQTRLNGLKGREKAFGA